MRVKIKLALVCMTILFAQYLPAPQLHVPMSSAETLRDRVEDESLATTPRANLASRSAIRSQDSQEPNLILPILLKREELQAGNPLATYAAMIELEPQYLKFKIFADFYRQTRFNFEEFMGLPLAGVQAMSLPSLRQGKAECRNSHSQIICGR
jgi:hypothetical protein